jgi:hypothetical protein
MLLSRMTRQRRIVDSQKLKQKIFQDHFCSMQKSKQPYPSSYVSFRRKIIDMFLSHERTFIEKFWRHVKFCFKFKNLSVM